MRSRRWKIWIKVIECLKLNLCVMISKVFVGEVGYSLDHCYHPSLTLEMKGYVKQRRQLGLLGLLGVGENQVFRV
jgi:hypothetical protein